MPAPLLLALLLVALAWADQPRAERRCRPWRSRWPARSC